MNLFVLRWFWKAGILSVLCMSSHLFSTNCCLGKPNSAARDVIWTARANSIIIGGNVSARATKHDRWNDRTTPLRDGALVWHRIWVDCGRSPAGALSMILRNTRARYHRAVRDLKRNQAELRKSKLADRAASADNKEFWAEVIKTKQTKIYDANASRRPQ